MRYVPTSGTSREVPAPGPYYFTPLVARSKMSCETHRSASSGMSSGSSGTEDFSSMDPCCSVIHRAGHERLRGTNHFGRR